MTASSTDSSTNASAKEQRLIEVMTPDGIALLVYAELEVNVRRGDGGVRAFGSLQPVRVVTRSGETIWTGADDEDHPLTP